VPASRGWTTAEEVRVANHLTPTELSEALGLDSKEVVRICVEESVPIYNGRIDKTLFAHSLMAVGHPVSENARALLQPAG
jgi:hypothetical protein